MERKVCNMKYFSVSYRLTAEDYNEYDRLYNRDYIKLRFKRLIPLYVVPIIICAFMDLTTAIIVGVMALFSFILPFLGNREFSKLRAESSLFKRESTVEFYDNHIVTRLLPDGNFRSETEKHYGFNKINRIFESESSFYFTFKDNSLLVIPKKYVGQDEYTMTFFLDEGEWVSSVIYINSWRVVLNDTELN